MIAISMARGMILGWTTSSALVVTHSKAVYRKMPRISAWIGELRRPGRAESGMVDDRDQPDGYGQHHDRGDDLLGEPGELDAEQVHPGGPDQQAAT